MDAEALFGLFWDTGEPMAYLLYAAAMAAEKYDTEDEILPSA